MDKSTMYQKLIAPNDRNGNPRRVYTLLNAQGDITLAIDEGYANIPKECRDLIELPTYYITTTEYRQILKNFGNKND